MFRLRTAAATIAVAAAVMAGARWYMHSHAETERRANESELRAQLSRMRDAIARFRSDRGRHPHTLAELTPAYLPGIPRDPFTGSAGTWRLTTEETVQPNADFTSSTPPNPETFIIDVHSGAGAPYSDW